MKSFKLGLVLALGLLGNLYSQSISVEKYDNISSDNISNLKSSSKFKNNQPDSLSEISSLSRGQQNENYGQLS